MATSAKRSSKRAGFGTSYTAKQLKLTAKVATRLNKSCGRRTPSQTGKAEFSPGERFGAVSFVAQGQ